MLRVHLSCERVKQPKGTPEDFFSSERVCVLRAGKNFIFLPVVKTFSFQDSTSNHRYSVHIYLICLIKKNNELLSCNRKVLQHYNIYSKKVMTKLYKAKEESYSDALNRFMTEYPSDFCYRDLGGSLF